MRHRQLARVQREAGEEGTLVGASLVAALQVGEQQLRRAAVEGVVENRQARRRQMHADLVAPAGDRTAFQPGEAAKPLAHPETGRGRLAALFHAAHQTRPAFIRAQGQLDGELVRRGRAHHECMIELLRRAGLKLPAQKIEGGLGLGAEEHAAGVGVEPVHVGDVAADLLMDAGHEVRARLVPAVRDDEQAAGLVEDQQRLVLVDDRWKGHASSDQEKRGEVTGKLRPGKVPATTMV